MKLVKPVMMVFILVCFLTIGSRAQESIEGYWAGGSTLFGSPVSIQARFEKTPTGYTGYFSAPAWNAAKRALENVRFNSSNLHFEFPSSTMIPFVCDGNLKDGLLRGTLSRGDEKGNFHLVRVANISPKLFEQYVGGYQTEKGE